MKKATVFLLFLAGFSCQKPIEPDQDQMPDCASAETTLSIAVTDYYTQEALPGITFQLLQQSILSPFGPDLLASFSSRSDGTGYHQFQHQGLVNYYLNVGQDADSTHIYPWQLTFRTGCENEIKIAVKPVQILTLTLKNAGPNAYGNTIFSVVRAGGAPAAEDDFINTPPGYTFGSYTLDTIPPGFEKQFTFKVIPEQQLEIEYGWGNNKKSVFFTADAAVQGAFSLSIW